MHTFQILIIIEYLIVLPAYMCISSPRVAPSRLQAVCRLTFLQFFFLVTSWVHYAQSAGTSWVIMAAPPTLTPTPKLHHGNNTVLYILSLWSVRCGGYSTATRLWEDNWGSDTLGLYDMFKMLAVQRWKIQGLSGWITHKYAPELLMGR